MTANHAHTPTKGDLKKAWDWYRANQDKQSGIEQNFRTYRFEFLRAWDAIEAAAEQRGAARALRDTADHIENEIEFVLPNRYKPLRFRRSYEQDGTGLTPEEWLRARADRMEGDDETH